MSFSSIKKAYEKIWNDSSSDFLKSKSTDFLQDKTVNLNNGLTSDINYQNNLLIFPTTGEKNVNEAKQEIATIITRLNKHDRLNELAWKKIHQVEVRAGNEIELVRLLKKAEHELFNRLFKL